MRLAFLIPSLGLGGAERSLAKLVDVLAERGHEVAVLSLGGAHEDMLREFHPAVQVHCFHAGSSASPRMLWRVWRFLRTWRPDAVAGWSLYANFAAVLTAHAAGIRRVLVSERNYLPQMIGVGSNSLLRRRILSLLVRRFYGHASVVTANSSLSLRFLRHYAPGATRYAVLPNLADVGRYARLAEAPLPAGVDADAPHPRLLALGRLHQQKGFDLLVRAMTQVPVAVAPVLYLAGAGPEADALKALAAQQGVADRIRFIGEVTNPFPLYAWADVLVAPSRFEGFPNVPLEAMAMGTAVVVADCLSGPRELSEGGRYARLVPVDDVDALARATIALCADPAGAKALGQAARQHVIGHYSREAVEPVYLDVFEHL